MTYLARTLLALVLAVGASALVKNPTGEEWKENKARETAAQDAAAAKESKMGAVNKAVQMLEKLHVQVQAELEKETKTYNKFVTFCDDTKLDRNKAIEDGTNSKALLEANIEKLNSGHEALIEKIKILVQEIAAEEQAIIVLTETRKGKRKEYQANHLDLVGAVEALHAAIKALKASKTPKAKMTEEESLAQVKSVANTVKTAVVLADALGLTRALDKKVVAFLQQDPEVQFEDYKFHSDDIITTLETLQKEFRDKRTEVDEAEVASVQEYKMTKQDKQDIVKTKNKNLDDSKKAKAETMSDIQTNKQNLDVTSKTLVEDKDYLAKLSLMCDNKAKTWDQRSRVREEEIMALEQAVAIIKDKVMNNTNAKTVRLFQHAVSLRVAESVARNSRSMEAIEAAAEAAEAPSFLQQKSLLAAIHRLRGAPRADDDSSKAAVVDLLKKNGARLHSTTLATLASRIAADPLAKVKVLIQELVERLLQEANAETDQKGWCDKNTKEAKQKRADAADEVRKLNAEMAETESQRNRLAADVERLNESYQELELAQEAAITDRGEEMAENNATVAQAQEGLEALDTCIDILDKFYKTKAKESVDLGLIQQRGPAEDAPDAGFDIGEAYLGAQSESGGILAMLDVMKSDFTRTIQETKEAEKQASQDHLNFMTETGKSLAQTEEAQKSKSSQKDEAVDRLATASNNLNEHMDTILNQIKELKLLKDACIDTGMSYEERVARRKDEIEALKQALSILGNYNQ